MGGGVCGFFLYFLFMLRGFNVHIQCKLLKHTFVVGASSDLGQHFHPRHFVRVFLIG